MLSFFAHAWDFISDTPWRLIWYQNFGQDIVSLVVQAAGGAMASSASGNGYDPTPVRHISFLCVWSIFPISREEMLCLEGSFSKWVSSMQLVLRCWHWNIMIATITIYVVCAIEFFVRYLKNLPIRLPPLINTDGKRSSIRGYMDKRLKTMCVALSFSTVCLFIR